ncbi:hypothetical protein IAD21_03575 [Abditibacteriota bacterium]|nr:hypothetical protein IAD21_03575 [Abditibacteriota bacterium]
MPSSNSSWPIRILCGAGFGLVAVAILYPVFARSPESCPPRNGCQSNLKQIGLGILQYTQDYDGKFPSIIADGSAYGWADTLQPYLKSTQLYQCPKERTSAQLDSQGQPDPHKSGYTDYPFNGRFSGEELGQIEEPTEQVLSLDGNSEEYHYGTDARYSFTQIPPQWRSNNNSPLYRHVGIANYLFADGHVKALYPSQVEDVERPRAIF